MTHQEIALRLRALADREPTFIWRELYALAREIEDTASAPRPESKLTTDDIEAIMRATQPPTPPAGVRFLFGRRR